MSKESDERLLDLQERMFAKAAMFDEMRLAIGKAIGFCVCVRQDDPNWADHQNVGRLFAELAGPFERANKISEAKS